MSWDKAHDAIKMIETAVQGLETIQHLTKLGGDRASEVLAAIDSALVALIEGFDGKTSPDIVKAQIKSLHDRLAAGDTAATVALHTKFDTP